MTKLLQKAFAEAEKLPEPDQDALAALLLEELADEKRWAESFAGSQDLLARLADEALERYRKGETEPFPKDE